MNRNEFLFDSCSPGPKVTLIHDSYFLALIPTLSIIDIERVRGPTKSCIACEGVCRGLPLMCPTRPKCRRTDLLFPFSLLHEMCNLWLLLLLISSRCRRGSITTWLELLFFHSLSCFKNVFLVSFRTKNRVILQRFSNSYYFCMFLRMTHKETFIFREGSIVPWVLEKRLRRIPRSLIPE